jgi:hypothetical protein
MLPFLLFFQIDFRGGRPSTCSTAWYPFKEEDGMSAASMEEVDVGFWQPSPYFPATLLTIKSPFPEIISQRNHLKFLFL